MAVPPNDSPLWPLLKLAIVGTLLLVGVSYGYREGFVARSDLPILLSVLLPLMGIEGFQYMRKPPPEDKP